MISVIIPVYNVEDYLRQCLDSVVGQTCRDLEIILVDDGSTDGSGAICDEYASKDERVQVLHKENGGAAAARNDGIERASGMWIAFIDSDDWWDLDYCEKMMAALGDEKPDILMAGGHYFVNDQPVKVVSRSVMMTDPEKIRSLAMRVFVRNQDVDCLIPKSPVNIVVRQLYDRVFLRENGLIFVPELRYGGEDSLFAFQVFSRAHKVMTCDCIGYHIRYRQTSTMHRFNPDRSNSYPLCTELLYEDCVKLGYPVDVVYTSAIHNAGGALRANILNDGNPAGYAEKKRAFEEVKRWPYVQEAIRSRDNSNLMTHEIVMKYLLRSPWFWPIKLSWAVYARFKKRKL